MGKFYQEIPIVLCLGLYLRPLTPFEMPSSDPVLNLLNSKF